MSGEKKKIPAVEGWFDWQSEEPHLIGSRCKACGAYFFPKETVQCRNPSCRTTDLEEVALSNRGRLWSYTNNCYKPPAPYVSPDPFEPYAIGAVELEREKMVVLGQMARGVRTEDLQVGMPVELVIETLFEDDEHEVLVWKWKPAGEGAA
ncbi:MAG: benzoylsuccinyl-CoA thiolase [Candidatus Dadabacteria bacterium]|nr:MAG: benzoylsuccinyl-CoA thiolase [Candidatus Dadabacteria bacterium]